MRTVILCCVCWSLLLSLAAGQQVVAEAPVAETPVAKAAAEPFTFTIDRGSYGDYGYTVSGTLRSTQPGRLVRGVYLVLSAYDDDGKLLGRATPSVEGADEGAGEVGYVNDCSIKTENRMPAKIECEIIPPPGYDDIQVVKSKEETSSDAPLMFELQKVGSSYSGLSIYGKVTNPTDNEFENVTVIVTLYGPGGKFLGRGRTSTTPSKIGGGQVGYIDSLSVEVGNWRPVKLEWKIITSDY